MEKTPKRSTSKAKAKGSVGRKRRVVQKVPKSDPKLSSIIELNTPLNSSRGSVKKPSFTKFEASIQFSEEARNPQNSSIREVECDSFAESDDELVSLLGIAGSTGKCSRNESNEELHENVLQEDPIKSFMTDSNNIQNLGFNDGHKSDWFCEEIKESLKEISTEKDEGLLCHESCLEEKKQESFEESRVYTGEKILEAFERVERMVIKQVEKGKKIKDAREKLKGVINKVKGVSENRRFVDLWMRCIRCLDILKTEDEKLKERIEKENWNIDDEKKRLEELNDNLYFSQQTCQSPEVYFTAFEENSQETKEIQDEIFVSDLIKEERDKYGCSIDISIEETREKGKLIEDGESYFADDDKTLSTAQKKIERRTFGLESTNKKPSPQFRIIPLSTVFRGTDISGMKRRERDSDDVDYENALEEELSSIRKMMRTETTVQILPRAGSQETKSSDYLTKSTECTAGEEVLERFRQQRSQDFDERRRNLDLMGYEGNYRVEGLNRLSPPVNLSVQFGEKESGIQQEPNLPSG